MFLPGPFATADNIGIDRYSYCRDLANGLTSYVLACSQLIYDCHTSRLITQFYGQKAWKAVGWKAAGDFTLMGLSKNPSPYTVLRDGTVMGSGMQIQVLSRRQMPSSHATMMGSSHRSSQLHFQTIGTHQSGRPQCLHRRDRASSAPSPIIPATSRPP